MTFAGWSLATLAPLFAAGAAVVTGLYLLRMRRREVVVPFAALWAQVAQQSERRRLWNRLRRVLSWLLQIAILALLCLALGDPRPTSWLRTSETVAVVVDRSASMAGLLGPETQETRLHAAIAAATEELATLGPNDAALLVAAGSDVEILAPLGPTGPAFSSALERLAPQPGEADLGRALALAQHALEGRSSPRILVLTDGAVDSESRAALERCVAAPMPCAVQLVTGPHDNVGITTFAARRYPHAADKIEVLAEVRNFGDAPVEIDLDIEAEGVRLGRQRMTLGPGEARREILPELDAARAELVARVLPPDGGALLGPRFDDVAHAVVPPLRPLDVTLVSGGDDLFLEAALLTLGDHVRLHAMDVATARDQPRAPALVEADLVFYDPGAEPLPEALPATHRVFFDPWRHPTSPCPIRKKADVVRPFLTEQARRHPLFEHIVLKDVNIARGTTLQADPGDTVLARSLGEPMIVLREDEHVDLAIGFDPRQSDLALRTAFPLLVDNIVRYVEQRAPGFVAAMPLGSTRLVALAELGLEPRGVTRVRLEPPAEAGDAASELPVEAGQIRLRGRAPGIYGIVALDGAAAGARVEVAVQPSDPQASDLHPRVDAGLGRAPRTAADASPDPATPGFDGPVWTLLVLLVAALVALEWASYHRRITV